MRLKMASMKKAAILSRLQCVNLTVRIVSRYEFTQQRFFDKHEKCSLHPEQAIGDMSNRFYQYRYWHTSFASSTRTTILMAGCLLQSMQDDCTATGVVLLFFL